MGDNNTPSCSFSSQEKSRNLITITVTYKSKPSSFDLPRDATLSDLSDAIAECLSVPPVNQKLIVPNLGLLRAPFSSTTSPGLSALEFKKIILMGATAETVSSIQHTATVAARRAQNQATARIASRSSNHLAWAQRGSRNNLGRKDAEESGYTFLSIRPLPYLPDPPASQRYLERLAADPGIRQAMRVRKFAVGLLTEMDPAAHTKMSLEGVGRTLGLNRNRGEVIELRLRTDAGDGYRDYKTVRRTLCHELAHNVHSAHDSKFWNLCREIEREVEGVEAGDRTLVEREGPTGPVGYHEKDCYDDIDDHGGWSGGEFVLGGDGPDSLSRRDIMARAAEKRLRRQGDAHGGSE